MTGVQTCALPIFLSTLTWIEKALVRGDLNERDLINYKRFKKHCAYQNLTNYFKNNTEIEYKGRSYFFLYQNGNFSIEKNPSNGYIVPKIMYIPAERNFVSAVDKPDKLKYLPAPLVTFLTEYEKAKDEIKSSISLPINNTSFEYDKLNKISHIKGADYKVRLSEASSGFQSFVPLYLVSRSLALSLNQDVASSKKELSVEEERRIKHEIKMILSNDKLSEEIKRVSLEVLSSRFKSSCFVNIVEEPEQNLYPFSQKEILFRLLEFANLNENNRLVLTTHSPYIINFLSLAIKAKEVLNQIGSNNPRLADLEKIVPKTACISSSDVVIYQQKENGSVERLPTFEGLPSDDNFLNRLLSETNDLFINLLEIQQKA